MSSHQDHWRAIVARQHGSHIMAPLSQQSPFKAETQTVLQDCAFLPRGSRLRSKVKSLTSLTSDFICFTGTSAMDLDLMSGSQPASVKILWSLISIQPCEQPRKWWLSVLAVIFPWSLEGRLGATKQATAEQTNQNTYMITYIYIYDHVCKSALKD